MHVAELIARRALSAVFQPIVNFDGGRIVGYEGLIRGPAASALEMPDALFGQAAVEGCTLVLEQVAAMTCIEAYARLGCAERLFINFSAGAIEQISQSLHGAVGFITDCGLRPNQIVIELTEQSEIADVTHFMSIVVSLREAGVHFALDDYGTANASMNLWVRLRPDIVKIDRFFVHDISTDPLKFEAVKAMQQFARVSGAQLIAEGIESEADLMVVRDMGFGCGQGFFFGAPQTQPERTLPEHALRALAADHVAVFPELIRSTPVAPPGSFAAARMLVNAPGLSPHATNNEVLETFAALPTLHALAIVENGKPVGLINRRRFMERFALPYHRELFGRKSCAQFANRSPVLIERSMTVEQMAKLLAGDDQSYLADGFVITDDGRYVGLGTGESLVRAVTEIRIEAARYANPLTFLPGNIPISSHIDRLLDRLAPFHACYVDLNHFKPFNDQYGYWQGDEILRLAAQVLSDVCDPTRDFLGHVGGDDFLILFQSDDWCLRVQRAVERFNESAQRFYAPEDRAAGGIHGEDRRGQPTFYGFVTMAVGTVRVQPNRHAYRDSEAIASAAAVAKRRAKQEASGLYLLEDPPEGIAAA